MKKGVIVFASLALLLGLGAPAFSQVASRSVETIMIDNFDGTDSNVDWTWNVQASRFVTEGYPIVNTFDALPNSLKAVTKADESHKVLGVKIKFDRKGDNWFEVYPEKDGKPYEIPFAGTVKALDFWVWGAHYLYFLDILVRDADGRVHILRAGNLAFDGWKQFIIDIPTYIRQHSRLRSGPAEMKFVGFRITTDAAEYVDDYMIYFDHFKYSTNALSNIFDGYELQNSDFGDNNENKKEGK
ncbi:MAG: flagellar filament outer layer protein FlaA [Treponema sp.]|nr:flagellar filament outer layer protein FlaA [Treponema sp.]